MREHYKTTDQWDRGLQMSTPAWTIVNTAKEGFLLVSSGDTMYVCPAAETVQGRDLAGTVAISSAGPTLRVHAQSDADTRVIDSTAASPNVLAIKGVVLTTITGADGARVTTVTMAGNAAGKNPGAVEVEVPQTLLWPPMMNNDPLNVPYTDQPYVFSLFNRTGYALPAKFDAFGGANPAGDSVNDLDADAGSKDDAGFSPRAPGILYRGQIAGIGGSGPLQQKDLQWIEPSAAPGSLAPVLAVPPPANRGLRLSSATWWVRTGPGAEDVVRVSPAQVGWAQSPDGAIVFAVSYAKDSSGRTGYLLTASLADAVYSNPGSTTLPRGLAQASPQNPPLPWTVRDESGAAGAITVNGVVASPPLQTVASGTPLTITDTGSGQSVEVAAVPGTSPQLPGTDARPLYVTTRFVAGVPESAVAIGEATVQPRWVSVIGAGDTVPSQPAEPPLVPDLAPSSAGSGDGNGNNGGFIPIPIPGPKPNGPNGPSGPNTLPPSAPIPGPGAPAPSAGSTALSLGAIVGIVVAVVIVVVVVIVLLWYFLVHKRQKSSGSSLSGSSSAPAAFGGVRASLSPLPSHPPPPQPTLSLGGVFRKYQDQAYRMRRSSYHH